MKTILSIILFLGVCGICTAQEGFKIVGQLGGSLGGKLVLAVSGEQGFVKLGETEMVNGSFEFSGSVPGPGVAYIMDEKQQLIATIMIENREFLLTAGGEGIDVEGGEAQEVWNVFDAINKRVMRANMIKEQKFQVAYARQDRVGAVAVQQEFQKVVLKAMEEQREFFKNYGDTYVAAYAVYSLMEQANFDQLGEWYNLLGENAKNTAYGKALGVKLEQFRNVVVGGVAPDFEGTQPEGGTLSLYEVKGKIKLVDFWGSWCGPCRMENKNLPKLYKKYHKAGLEIISVSLDNKQQDWLKAIKDDNMTWKHVSDLKGWGSAIARLYQVKAIPQTFLLDAENHLIAKNLRGADLQKKIAELLGGK